MIKCPINSADCSHLPGDSLLSVAEGLLPPLPAALSEVRSARSATQGLYFFPMFTRRTVFIFNDGGVKHVSPQFHAIADLFKYFQVPYIRSVSVKQTGVTGLADMRSGETFHEVSWASVPCRSPGPSNVPSSPWKVARSGQEMAALSFWKSKPFQGGVSVIQTSHKHEWDSLGGSGYN